MRDGAEPEASTRAWFRRTKDQQAPSARHSSQESFEAKLAAELETADRKRLAEQAFQNGGKQAIAAVVSKDAEERAAVVAKAAEQRAAAAAAAPRHRRPATAAKNAAPRGEAAAAARAAVEAAAAAEAAAAVKTAVEAGKEKRLEAARAAKLRGQPFAKCTCRETCRQHEDARQARASLDAHRAAAAQTRQLRVAERESILSQPQASPPATLVVSLAQRPRLHDLIPRGDARRAIGAEQRERIGHCAHVV